MPTLSQVEEAIRGLSAPKDYGQVLQEVARQTRDDTRERFIQEVDPDGNDWAELAEETKERKAKEGYPQAKLVEVGTLFESLGDVDEVMTDNMEWGTADEKAHFHQDGTRNMPQREIVGFSERDMDGMEEKIADFVEQEVLKAFDGLV